MFLAIIAFTLNSFRNYFMLNQQNSIDDESDNDDDYEIGNSNISDKIRSIITYICTYLWGISFIILIFIIYASIRGPFNIINSFTTGKHLQNGMNFINLLMLSFLF